MNVYLLYSKATNNFGFWREVGGLLHFLFAKAVGAGQEAILRAEHPGTAEKPPLSLLYPDDPCVRDGSEVSRVLLFAESRIGIDLLLGDRQHDLSVFPVNGFGASL